MVDNRVRFARPPVMEVVCGIAFSLPQALRTIDVGSFWQTVVREFPNVEEKPPFPSVLEQFGVDVQPSINVEFQQMPPLRRVWFVSRDQRTLLQIQEDRFNFNWRKLTTDGDDVYPSYDSIIALFWKYWDLFTAFLTTVPSGEPTVTQLELAYVNAVEGSREVDGGLHSILVDHVRAADGTRFLPQPELFNWVSSYQLPDAAGRLHVTAQSAKKTTTREPLVKLELAARGLPSNTVRPDLEKWFSMSHDWITHGFADVTSKDAHTRIWGRIS